MARTAILSLTGSLNGMAIGYLTIGQSNTTLNYAAAIGKSDYPINLAAGPTTFSVAGGNMPTGASMFIFFPPAGNTNLILLKKVAGDTGFELHKLNWSAISYDAANISFVLSAAALTNGCEILWI